MEKDPTLKHGERIQSYARNDPIISMNSRDKEKDSSLALGMTGFSLGIREN
jgi:hypothetical protein